MVNWADNRLLGLVIVLFITAALICLDKERQTTESSKYSYTATISFTGCSFMGKDFDITITNYPLRNIDANLSYFKYCDHFHVITDYNNLP